MKRAVVHEIPRDQVENWLLPRGFEALPPPRNRFWLPFATGVGAVLGVMCAAILGMVVL